MKFDHDECKRLFDSNQGLDVLHPFVCRWIFTSDITQSPTEIVKACKAMRLHPILEIVEDQADLAEPVAI